MKINWYSRFRPTGRQLELLRARFGECSVEHASLRKAEKIAKHLRSSAADECVCVQPLAALEHVLRAFDDMRLKKPLWADVQECKAHDPECDIRTPDGRFFRSVGFRRLAHVGLRTEDPRPTTDKRPVRVLVWMRHTLDWSQIEAVKAIYDGEAVLTQVSRPLSAGARNGVRDVLREMKSRNCDDILIVAPLSFYDELIKNGKNPLFSVMKRRRFIRLVRVLGLDMRFGEV